MKALWIGLITLSLASCINPFQTSDDAVSPSAGQQYGSIAVSTGGISASTITPDVKAQVDFYELTLINETPGTYDDIVVPNYVEGTAIEDIPVPGTWTLELNAYNTASELVAVGTPVDGNPIDIPDTNPVAVTVELQPLSGGVGSFDFTLDWSAALGIGVEVNQVDVTLYSFGNAIGETRTVDEDIPTTSFTDTLVTDTANAFADFGNSTLTITDLSLNSGSYRLAITLYKGTGAGAVAYAPVIEAVQIFDNLETTGIINLTAGSLTSPPAAPSGLNVVQIDLEPTVQLSWIDEANTEEGYRVYRDGTLISGDLGPNVTTYPDEPGVGGVEYTYEVRAFNSFGESVSGAATRTVTLISDVGLEAPLNLAENVALRTNFEWDPGFGADTLELFIFEDGNLVFSEVGIPGTQGGFILDEANQLNRQTDYTWYVVARNTDFEVQTPELSFTTADNIIRVAPNGGGDGSGWDANAADFQWAVDESINIGPVEIWVQAGTYEPVGRPNGGDAGDPRTRHFALRPNVEVYGGFAGTETDRSQRDPVANETIFSGGPINVNFLGATLELGGNENNVYHVFYHPTGTNLTRDTVLDGVIVEGGNADGDGSQFANNRGGGMFLENSEVTIRNAVFRHNYAGEGGGIALIGNSSAQILDSTFDRNLVDRNGGGVFASAMPSNPTVIRGSLFSGNRQTGQSFGGAALMFRLSEMHVVDSHFESNSAFYYGGAIVAGTGVIANSSFSGNSNTSSIARGGAVYVSGQTWVINSVFSDNTSASDGGAIMVWQGPTKLDVRLINLTIYNNEAANGGAIMFSGAEAVIYNSILWGNNATANDGLEIYGTGTGLDVSISNTTIQGYPAINESVVFVDPNAGVIDASVNSDDPLFSGPANPVGVDGIWRTADDGLRLSELSPARNTGNNALLPLDIADIDNDGTTAEPIPIDIIGNPRVNGTVDRGAYEYQ